MNEAERILYLQKVSSANRQREIQDDFYEQTRNMIESIQRSTPTPTNPTQIIGAVSSQHMNNDTLQGTAYSKLIYGYSSPFWDGTPGARGGKAAVSNEYLKMLRLAQGQIG